MTLAWLILLPLLGGVLAWLVPRSLPLRPRRVALAVVSLQLLLALWLWAQSGDAHGGEVGEGRFAEAAWPWIPRFGIAVRLGLDGLSLAMILLTALLGVVAVVASREEIREREGFFHFCLLWTLAGVNGAFLALDLFLFFLFWELMLVPMYFLIALWGHEGRQEAALKFFLFTQASGLLMLLAILALAFAGRQATGSLTFDYDALLAGGEPAASRWIMLGFFIAFAVKLPAVPFHPWLPDAHTQAPTAGSILLAGVLLKVGGYGLLRFILPLFPESAAQLAPWAMALGAAGILYGALLAFAQDDFKRLVAYSSISHMGFVLLAASTRHPQGVQGAVLLMVAHGVTVAALFALAGVLQRQLGTRQLGAMGGLWAEAPRLAAFGLFFAVAALGLPGLSSFAGEFLALLTAFRVSPAMAIVAAGGVVLAALYSLTLVQRAFHGPPGEGRQRLAELGPQESVTLAVLALVTLWLGLYPGPLLELAAPWARALFSPPTVPFDAHLF